MKEKKKKDHEFQEGNQFWRNIDPSNIGRNPKFKTPEDLWKAVVPYFDYCDNNPIQTKETKTIIKNKTDKSEPYETKIVHHKIPYTWEGMYSYIGVCSLDHYKTKSAFSGIIGYIKNIIYNQKFSGAAAGIFNANLIARDLGIKDTQNVNHGGQEDNPIEFYVYMPDNNRDKKK